MKIVYYQRLVAAQVLLPAFFRNSALLLFVLIEALRSIESCLVDDTIEIFVKHSTAVRTIQESIDILYARS